ncbi:hypothetical protein NECAME_18868, partial [Necator americanus]
QLYSAVLGYADTQTNRNSYYKIQLLKHDTKPLLFVEKTGNAWKQKKKFTKRAGLMDLIETDFTELEGVKTSDITPGSRTKLDKAIKEVILMIFDIQQLQKTMLDFKIDLDKMPLGKLSKKQIMSAYSVLTELQQ